MLAGPRDEVAPTTASEPAASTEPAPEEPPAVTSPTELAADPLCVDAVDAARAAAVEVAGSAVGDHLGAEVEGDEPNVVTHSFATTDPAYVGWRWAVTVVRAEDAEGATVDEVVLLPGTGALLAPAWVPWSERIQPGDLSPGDLLPPPKDDPRLVPSYADVEAERMPFELHREMGLGRPRVLSLDGRADAAERWYEGPSGPDTPMAKQAPARCVSCGFLAPMAGALGRVFGVCANGMAPDDGRVVAMTHGCGAHSEVVVETPESSFAGMAVVDDEFEVVQVERAPSEGATDVADAADVPASAEGQAGGQAEAEVQADASAAAETADAPEDAALPGVDDPPLDDVVVEDD